MMLPVDQTDVEARRPDSAEPFRPANALLHGYLRKLKRMKKKYFILFADTDALPARLEYFDSEKKWRHGQPPKRSIVIKTCFSINRRYDCKHKLVVALFTREECFPIAFETEEELTRWFITLLQIQLADRLAEGDELKPIYEHVWQVTVTKKGLGSEKNLVGQHRLCLSAADRVLTLIRMPMSDPLEVLEFPVMTIRRCGQISSQFFMEMGRATVTGAGGLWMEADETSTAQYMHAAIIEAMRNSAKDDLAPRTRTRSSSANEQNRPSYVGGAWNAASTSPAANPPPGCAVPATALGMAVLRSRADSVPSRSRSSSETVVEGRPSSAHYVQDPLATSASPPVIPGSMISTSSLMDDVVDGPSHHTPMSSYTRSRLSHTATPENSLPKESTILEEERTDDNTNDYLLMSYTSRPDPSADYLPMASKPILSSSPSAQSVSSVGRSSSVSSSVRSGIKSQRTTPGPPPIKQPLHPNPYMEMTSPGTGSSNGATWSSPPHATDGYMPMFAGHSAPGSVGTRSGTHTRSSSFCDDTAADSYVPMAPLSVASSVTSRDGDAGSYMDMQFRGSVPKDVPPPPHPRGRHSPASSSSLASSVTSGTPPVGSAGSRFHEYHLEKVASLLTPSEDDDSVSILRCRQSRAYSVGARPEARTRRLSPIAQDVASTGTSTAGSGYSVAAQHSLGNQDARVRAYSVGSRGTPGAVQLSSNVNGSSASVQSAAQHECHTPHTSPAHCPQAQQLHSDESQRKKSLSVPVLGPGSVPNPTGTFVRAMMAQQQTGNRRDDLMEIEFRRTHNGFFLSTDSVDQTDGVSSSSYAAQYGSTDSVGRSSVASSSSGIGRSRSSVGQVRPGFSSAGRCGKKMEPFRAAIRPRLERLESVPQGRDQDYIDVGDHQTSLNPSLDSPDVLGPASFARSALNGGEKHLDRESGDEYVELAEPLHESRSRDSVPRLSVSELGASSSATSPGDSEYMPMESNLNKNMAGSLTTVLCRIAQEPESSSYMDMSFGQRTRPSSQPGSVSDDFNYLPMDFTPKSSRNPSRQSSQADLDLVIGAVSPSMRGSLTPRSESARHSRTEESFAEHMEITFDHLPGSTSSLRCEKSARARMPSPYDGTSDAADQTSTPSAGSKMNKATAFFTHLWSRKSSSVGKVHGAVGQAVPVATEAPRPSRSMPPSPFSSLKRPAKSSKKRRSTTTVMQSGQSMSPVSPDADASQTSLCHQRSHSMRSGSRNSLQSPLTPPSPTVDFARPQFSPPSPAIVAPKPGSSQPISIGFQRSAAFTPRGSPVIGLHGLNVSAKPAPASDEYVLPVLAAPTNRYSASPSRLVTMPTLSPLPEVNFKAHLYAPDTPARSPAAADYVNMDFAGQSKANSNQFRLDESPPAVPDAGVPLVNRTEPSAPVPIPQKSANEDKENDIVMTIPPIDSKFIDLNSGSTVSTPTAIPTKQRANSLEKIVSAMLDVSKPGPKRHSSGDKPHKRSSGVSIFRSNSYQPSSSVSRIVVAGNKPASLFPLLTDIPAGRILTTPSSDEARQSRSPSLSTQSSVNNSSRLSVSSTASQGDDAAGELQGISWSSGERLSCSSSSSGTVAGFISVPNGASPAMTLTSNSSSPALLFGSRPVQASEHEINYAQLDLVAAPAGHRGSVGAADDASVDAESQKSPRIPRPASTTAVFGFPDGSQSSLGTTYAQIDFKKTDGAKMTAHS